MKIEKNLPGDIDRIDPKIGTSEVVPSHIMTSHGSKGGVLTAELEDGRAVSLVTPGMDREQAVMLSWTGIDRELEADEREKLDSQTEDFVRNTYEVESVETVETEYFKGQDRVQEAMMNSWGSTGMPEQELIPTYEFEAKERGENLIILERDDAMALAYMFPDPENSEAVHSHAVGVESHNSNIGAEIKTKQREEVLNSGHDTIYWTVDPLKPLNNRLNTTKLGGKATEYKQDVYNTDTSGGTPADRFVIEWDIRSQRVKDKVSALDEGTKDYLREDIYVDNIEPVLSIGEELPDYENSIIRRTETGYSLPEIPEGPVSVEIPRAPVEEMSEEVEEEWRYATRSALENLMKEGYEVTELMVPGENGFDQNTYILEK